MPTIAVGTEKRPIKKLDACLQRVDKNSCTTQRALFLLISSLFSPVHAKPKLTRALGFIWLNCHQFDAILLVRPLPVPSKAVLAVNRNLCLYCLIFSWFDFSVLHPSLIDVFKLSFCPHLGCAFCVIVLFHNLVKIVFVIISLDCLTLLLNLPTLNLLFVVKKIENTKKI